MSTKKFLHYISGEQVGLHTLLVALKKKLATKSQVKTVRETTDLYVIDVDYSQLEFNTNLIVFGAPSSPVINVGQVGALIIADS